MLIEGMNKLHLFPVKYELKKEDYKLIYDEKKADAVERFNKLKSR